jgi:hypothetical protein
MSKKRTSPMPGQIYQTVEDLDSYEASAGRFATKKLKEAQVITSVVDKAEVGFGPTHKLIIDLDLPAQLIPSSTPGHFHLYVDKEIPDAAWQTLLFALASAGLIEPGYMRASIARGFTAVRLPWVKKTADTAVATDGLDF